MDAATALPADLAGPVDVALARLEDGVPGEHAMAGGSVYELKWDGYRLVVVHDGSRVRLWSRNRNDLTDRFPDVAAAATAQVPPGTVLDGEVVIWERRATELRPAAGADGQRADPRRRAGPAAPGVSVAFDILAWGGAEQRRRPWSSRRRVLEELAAGWVPPLQLSPVTHDVDEAHRWCTDYRPAGIEGLLVMGAHTRYSGRRRDWVKVKSRETGEVISAA